MSRQNYYQRRRSRQRQEVEGELVVALVQAERQIQPRLGGRKVHHLVRAALAEGGVALGRDRFFAVLRAAGLLLARKPAAFPSTTDSTHYLPVFKNLIKDVVVSQPNEVWVADLTYLRTKAGFIYLSLVTDKYSRKIVGYHCGETLAAVGCVAALELGLAGLPVGCQPIHHSDRGSQYCCHEYVQRLAAGGLAVSMTEQQHCAENALAERVNGILKSEYGLDQEFENKESAKLAVDQAIDLYNTRRPHMSLQLRTPEMVHSMAV